MAPDRLTVFDLEKVAPDELLALCERTLVQRPLLSAIYDGAFLRAQIERRRDLTENGLLLHLVLPDNTLAQGVLDRITADLETLGPNATRRFRDKMRDPDRNQQETWRTELSFAAWITKLGYDVDLEPRVGKANLGEFRVASTPETWWEIKTPLDVKAVRDHGRIEEAIAQWLRKIPEPFTLDVMSYDLPAERVPAAAKTIRAQLAELHKRGSALPATVASDGLVIRPRPRAGDGGGLGVQFFKEYHWTNEHATIASTHIRDAARKQIPPKTAGVVVIDRTVATLMHDDAVEDACFGPLAVVRDARGEYLSRQGGIFRASYNTRVAAVVSYSRAYVRHFPFSGRDITILHNPHAYAPIPYAVFAADDVRQTVFSRTGNREAYRMVTGKGDPP